MTGEEIKQIVINKGQKVVIGIHSYNKSKLMWENPLEFYPERFENNRIEHSPQTMTFIDGWVTFNINKGTKQLSCISSRVCIGQKVALLEIKILIYYLIKNFTFDLPNPPQTIIKGGRLVHHPFSKEKPEMGTGLELIMKICKFWRSFRL